MATKWYMLLNQPGQYGSFDVAAMCLEIGDLFCDFFFLLSDDQILMSWPPGKDLLFHECPGDFAV